jgi:hypothetical protein
MFSTTWDQLRSPLRRRIDGDTAPAIADRLLTVLAPTDFPADLPFYVVDRRDHPALGWPDGYDGLFHSMLDWWLKPALEARRKWRGRGPAIAVDGRLNLVEFAEIAMHEAAHVLTMLTGEALVEPVMDCSADVLEAATVRPLDSGKPAVADARKTSHATHGWRFVRALGHLVWRARRIGLYATAEGVRLTTAREELGSGGQYLAALAGEADAWPAWRSLRELDSVPPPDAFARLWQAKAGEAIAELPPLASPVAAAHPPLGSSPAGEPVRERGNCGFSTPETREIASSTSETSGSSDLQVLHISSQPAMPPGNKLEE